MPPHCCFATTFPFPRFQPDEAVRAAVVTSAVTMVDVPVRVHQERGEGQVGRREALAGEERAPVGEALTHERLANLSRAHEILTTLVETYPTTDAAERARQRLRDLEI